MRPVHWSRRTKGGGKRVGGDDIRGDRDHHRDLASILSEIGAMEGLGVRGAGSDLCSQGTPLAALKGTDLETPARWGPGRRWWGGVGAGSRQ